jgi:hypothetical protein
MKTVVIGTIVVLVFLSFGASVFKVVQNECWKHNGRLFSPPSLNSWDPTERVEAARQAGKKFGGKL